MAITFAGVPLLLEDPDGKIQEWLDHWLPLDDLRLVGEWPVGLWDQSHGLPVPNYAPRLRPKLNTWYRPVGASRWAFGLFLADTATKNRILSAIGSNNSPQSLRFEINGISRGWLAYLLPPRPVSARVDFASGLWILPIVDERWYWQFASAAQALTDSSTWSGLFSNLASALGITLHVDTISSSYGTPNATAFNASSYKNAAVMVDAAAHSVGQRVFLQYRSVGGDDYQSLVYQSGNFDTSTTRRTQNFARENSGLLQAGTLAAGALNFPAIIPASVQAVFRKWANGIVWDDEFYTVSKSASSAGVTGGTGSFTKMIHSTAFADYTSGALDNSAALDSLAGQIASDFYKSINWIQDSNFLGVAPWAETGYEDYVEFSIGRRRADGTYEARTRIHSIPYNFSVERMLHQVANTHEYGDIIEGRLDGGLAAGGTATLSVWEGKPVADSGRNLTVTDRHGWAVSANKWLTAHKINKIWSDIAAEC